MTHVSHVKRKTWNIAKKREWRAGMFL
jgi:hypothetical protein